MGKRAFHANTFIVLMLDCFYDTNYPVFDGMGEEKKH